MSIGLGVEVQSLILGFPTGFIFLITFVRERKPTLFNSIALGKGTCAVAGSTCWTIRQDHLQQLLLQVLCGGGNISS